MIDLSQLKDFLDLGGVFILAVILLQQFSKKMDLMEDKLVKILTLLTVLVKQTTRFNDVENVLGSDKEKVEMKLNAKSNRSL